MMISHCDWHIINHQSNNYVTVKCIVFNGLLHSKEIGFNSIRNEHNRQSIGSFHASTKYNSFNSKMLILLILPSIQFQIKTILVYKNKVLCWKNNGFYAGKN